jgi:hypothetical protein
MRICNCVKVHFATAILQQFQEAIDNVRRNV